jgi:hypothetical protein
MLFRLVLISKVFKVHFYSYYLFFDFYDTLFSREIVGEAKKVLASVHFYSTDKQCCQIFLYTIYQNGVKIYQITIKYQMAKNDSKSNKTGENIPNNNTIPNGQKWFQI